MIQPERHANQSVATIPRNSPHSAFTLVELLVVIAIVAILAAMLIPVLSQAKGQAQSAYCKNNLRQQSIAIQMYINDTHFYPYYEAPVLHPEAETGVHWEVTLEPYYPSLNTQSNSTSRSIAQNGMPNLAYTCPAYASMITAPYFNYQEQWWNNWSYGYNTWGSSVQQSADVPGLDYCLGPGVDAPRLWILSSTPISIGGPGSRDPNTPVNLPACRESNIAVPSQLFILTDSRGTGTGSSWTGLDSAVGITNYWQLAPRPQHGKVFNVAFADSHVTEIPISILFNQAVAARNWNVDYQPHPEMWKPGPTLMP